MIRKWIRTAKTPSRITAVKRAGGSRAAIRWCREEIANGGNRVMCLRFIADYHEELEEWEAAIDAADEVLREDPDDLWMLKLLARCHVRMGDWDAAYSVIERALAHPAEPEVKVTGMLRWSLKALALIPRYRNAEEFATKTMKDMRRSDEKWRSWALEWKQWYEATQKKDEPPRQLH